MNKCKRNECLGLPGNFMGLQIGGTGWRSGGRLQLLALNLAPERVGGVMDGWFNRKRGNLRAWFHETSTP